MSKPPRSTPRVPHSARRAAAVPAGATSRRIARLAAAASLLFGAAACSGDDPTDPGDGGGDGTGEPVTLAVRGLGEIAGRFTGEVAVRGNTAYTTTWGRRGVTVGNALYVWDVSGATPALVDSVFVEDAITLGDVQVSDDGALLMVATEFDPGSVVLYRLTDPRKPQRIARFTSPSTASGVHTAKFGRVGGTLYAFLSVDPSPARLVVLDLADPAAPREVLAREMGRPFLHDVFVRDGLLFTALWHDGLTIWDVGGGGRGGTPSNPVQLGNVRTVGGSVHNIAWVHLPAGGRRYAWVGEEGPGSVTGRNSSGDIHVVDVTDMTAPREVAFLHVPGAGVHNFAVDEDAGVLYAAYYNAGVRALDVRGDVGGCDAAHRATDGRCDLAKTGRVLATALTGRTEPVFVWGVALEGGSLYASDMWNGIWKVGALGRE
ncbi:MAG TPA: hypothetical protein VGE02_09675 [Gemmatimonadales bacterium]